MFTAPEEHMPYTIQLHVVSIQPANKAAEHQSRKSSIVFNAMLSLL